ncbi:MAG TPA: 2Fe-2S iron-sulfur cluster-binding protein [Thermoanaerobaculia bacterium]|nr:2Fe-2S iron-sulfur cluster-binding protein [Thermoanaerobaculia bacterium]
MTFTPLNRTAEAKDNETLLDVARRVGAPLGSSCGGVGICARCRVTVKSAPENLTPPTSIESRVAEERRLDPDERLACQAVVNGDCEITTGYW